VLDIVAAFSRCLTFRLDQPYVTLYVYASCGKMCVGLIIRGQWNDFKIFHDSFVFP
jgi:hypothetical protein